MIFGIADNGDLNAKVPSDGELGHGVGRVIGAFGVDVWKQIAEPRCNGLCAEDHHVLDGSKRGHEARSSRFIQDWASGTFQASYAGIAVYGGDQDVADLARGLQISDMADVQDIEATVSEYYLLTALFMLGDKGFQFLTRNDFRFR